MPKTVLPHVKPKGPRTWLRRIIGGGQIVETCPKWCDGEHENDRERPQNLDDLTHRSEAVALEVKLRPGCDVTPVMWPILSARIVVDPYSSEFGWNQPHILFEAAPDDIADDLTPAQFRAMVAQVRAHCDRLDALADAAERAVAEHHGYAA